METGDSAAPRQGLPQQRRDDVDHAGQVTPATTDAASLAAAARGDATAWDRIVAAHLPRVWTISAGAGLDGNDTRDVCQLVWLRLAQTLGSFSRAADLDAWIPETAAAEARKLVLLRSAQARAATHGPDNVIKLEPGFSPGMLTGPDA